MLAALSFDPMIQEYSTIAEYYRFGIELGIIDFSSAVDWADKVIEVEDAPSGEFVELALSRPRGRVGVVECLRDIPGARDSKMAGSLLLADLYGWVKSGKNIQAVAKKALNVARATDLSEKECFLFDAIDDELTLAISGEYGTVEQSKVELLEALSEYHERTKT